jgi:hypothetical protein
MKNIKFDRHITEEEVVEFLSRPTIHGLITTGLDIYYDSKDISEFKQRVNQLWLGTD